MTQPGTSSLAAREPRQSYFMPGPLIRCVCALLICVTHAATPLWFGFGDTGQPEGILVPATIYMLFSKTGTAGFILLAGVLLIPRTREAVGPYLTKRLHRWLPAILFAQALYLGWQLATGTLSLETLSWTDLVEPASTHLWFFYAMGVIYLAVVPMRWYVRQTDTMDGTVRLVALALPTLLTVGAMVIMALRGGAWGYLTPVNLLIYCGYAWTGYLLVRNPPRTPWLGIFLVVIGVVGTIVITIVISEATGELEKQFIHRNSLGMAALAIGQFLLLQRLDHAITAPAWRARITRLSDLTLGIFTIHPLLMALAGGPERLIVQLDPAWFWIALPAYGVALFVASAVVVWGWFRLAVHLPLVPMITQDRATRFQPPGNAR